MFQATFSQTKEIKGDTDFWYKKNLELQQALDLKDFEKSSDEFNFRFRNHGQAGKLSNKVILSPKQAENIYIIVQSSKILNLPSDKHIENWSHGMDGITYIIEHSDKESYG